MKPVCYVTTSWDDGHPLDLRLAAMLASHGIPGTFYVPRQCDRRVMCPAQTRELAGAFEIGAHTLTHPRLTDLRQPDAEDEIRGSKDYIQETTGRRCSVFAPPGGYFTAGHIDAAARAGFAGFRTTELMSLSPPVRRNGLALLATTLQIYEHSPASFLCNALKRRRPENFLSWLQYARGRTLVSATDRLLDHAIATGGVLHIWGHSWEIEERGLWAPLGFILCRLAERRDYCRMVTNAELAA